MLPPTSLDSGWTCDYTAESDTPAVSVNVASLERWSFDSDREFAWLKRSFRLKTVDFCVNYILHVGAAPVNTVIYINGEKAGDYPSAGTGAFALDVTMLVALEDNEIAFRVERGAAGRFGDVRLQAVPCD